MVLLRPTALRGVNASRFVRSVPRTQFRAVARRGYASGHGGHGDHAPSSDMPWLISAVAVTIPSCYFLWPEESHDNAHGLEVASHAMTHKDESDEAPEDAPKEDDEPAEEPKEDESKDDDSKDEAPKEDAPKEDKSEDDSSKDDKPDSTEGEKTSNKKVDGVQFKGKTSEGDENNEMTDTRKREPDSKGAFKKRIDSGYQKDLGVGESSKAPSDDAGAMDTKQKGLSNTPTRHSTAIHEDPEKSKKGEGAPETAKLMGPVDPNRPQAESPDRKDKVEKK